MFHITRHALRKIAAIDSLDLQTVLDVLAAPEVTYPSRRHPGQTKFIGKGVCLVVDAARETVVTAFTHLETTALREDQRRDRDAVAWASRAFG